MEGRRIAALIGGAAGVYVVLSELPYLASRSSLAPSLSALGIGLVALAIAQLLRSP